MLSWKENSTSSDSNRNKLPVYLPFYPNRISPEPPPYSHTTTLGLWNTCMIPRSQNSLMPLFTIPPPPPPKKKNKTKNNTSSQVSNFFFLKPIFPLLYLWKLYRNNDGMVLHKHTFVFVINLLPLGEEESNQELGLNFIHK